MQSALRIRLHSPTYFPPLRAGLISCSKLYHSGQNSRYASTKPSDPILALYTQKLQEFRLNKQKSKGVMFGTTPEKNDLYQKEVERLKKMYGGGNLDQFPKISFE